MNHSPSPAGATSLHPLLRIFFLVSAALLVGIGVLYYRLLSPRPPVAQAAKQTVPAEDTGSLRPLVGLVRVPTGSAWADFALATAPEALLGGMAWVPGGWFEMGDPSFGPDAEPVHRVVVDGLWMDRTEV